MGQELESHKDQGLALEEARPEIKLPPMYRVILLNDDYTPMDFVIEVLRTFFGMDHDRATQVMLHVHTKGKGVCGVFTFEIAETKVALVNDCSRQSEHPLKCAMEKA
jgi:ATP-dependent Clp protease adaptor protein ClpS